MIHNDLASFFNDSFSDKRINKRANQVLDSIIKYGSVVVAQCCATITQRVAAYRMFSNKKMDIPTISDSIYKNCKKQIKTSHVLCIQDTSEINYTGKIGRIGKDDPNIGPVTKDSNAGFYCHPMLVVDPIQAIPLGFSYIKLWNRSWDKKSKKERKYALQAIEEKESYRWIKSAKESLKNLPQGVKQTIIADRESDIYEAIHLIPNERTDLLIRSSSNRKLDGDDLDLLEKMQSLAGKHTYELKVKGNHSRKNRTALLTLRYGEVRIKRPADLHGEKYPKSITINCIYVVEDPSTVPVGEAPIEWRLLTTHPVGSIEEAMQCIEWYKMRWFIEEIFRLLKSEGMHIEDAQLESGESLKKLTLMGLIAAWHIMALKLGYDRQDDKNPAAVIFTQDQLKVLDVLLPTLEGKTEKQKNPYTYRSFAWAAWSIARLGGWSGYKSQAKPGYITFKNGYRDFILKYEAIAAFIAFKDVYRE